MKTLIVYYSLEGNTEYAAETMAKYLSADLLRIEPEKTYPISGPKKMMMGARDAMAKTKPRLRPYTVDLGAYDRIVLGTPVWASRPAPPLRSFYISHNLRGKKIALFVTSKSGKGEKCIHELRSELRDYDVDCGLSLTEPLSNPAEDTADSIRRFCEKLKAADPDLEFEERIDSLFQDVVEDPEIHSEDMDILRIAEESEEDDFDWLNEEEDEFEDLFKH